MQGIIVFIQSELCLSGSLLSRSFCGSFSSCLFSSLCSFFLSFSSLDGSLLLGNLLGNLLVDGLLSLQSGSSSVLLGFGISLSNLLQTILLVSLPGIELLLSSSLVEGAFLHAALEVLHHVDTLATENVTNSVSRLCTNLDPIQCTLEIQVYCGRIGVRVIGTNLLSKLTITWCS